jgi:hypothetical protein
MQRWSRLLPLTALCLLGACATRVPEMHDLGQTREQEFAREEDLAVHIKCELRQALSGIFAEEALNPNSGGRSADWLKRWGAQVSLKLQVDDMAGLAPSLTFIHPMRNIVSVFRTGGAVTSTQNATDALGFTLSSHATRVETIGFFYKFQDLLDEEAFRTSKGGKDRACEPAAKLFINGDLKIHDFIRSKVQIARIPNLINPKAPSSDPFTTFNYDVIFVVVKSGNVTPAWKLVTLSINSGSSPFLSASRTGTDDLTITMAPVQDNGLDANGQAQHAASLQGQQRRN